MIAAALAFTMMAASPALPQSAFDARMRQSVAAAQALEGPLDGSWTLYAGRQAVYVFQIVDQAGGGGKLEAAWRNLGAGEGRAGVGVVSIVVRVPGGLRLAFSRIGAAPTDVRLRGNPVRGWHGIMTEDGRETPVVLRRDKS